MIRRPPRYTLELDRRQRQMCIRDSFLSSPCKKASCFPSGDHSKFETPSEVSVNGKASPPPGRITWIWFLSPRLEIKAIHCPSGDHFGFRLSAEGLWVRGKGVLPSLESHNSRSKRFSDQSVADFSKTTCRPSGEMTGLDTDRSEITSSNDGFFFWAYPK